MKSLLSSLIPVAGLALLAVPIVACSGGDGGSQGWIDAAGNAAAVDAASSVDAFTEPDAIDPAVAFQQCLFDNCGTELGDCVNDTECSGWLACNQGCDPDDTMMCPTICGWYYQSPFIAPFATCIFDHECVVQDFSEFPNCDAPEVVADDLAGLDGTWWLARHVSEDYALTSECQKLDLDELSSTEIDVISTAPLTLDDEERICRLVGTYRQNPDGTIAAEYSTSYVDYFEKWTLVHKSANAFLVDICFGSPTSPMKKYGTWLFARIPVADFESEELAALDAAANTALGYGVAEMEPVVMTGCPNE